MAGPKFAEAQQILQEYRAATTPRAKQEVIKSIKRRGFPDIAERFEKLLAEEQEAAKK